MAEGRDGYWFRLQLGLKALDMRLILIGGGGQVQSVCWECLVAVSMPLKSVNKEDGDREYTLEATLGTWIPV